MAGHADEDAQTANAHIGDMLLRTGEGDRAAFRLLYELTSARLFGIALRICGDRDAAEDVLHQVYVTVWHDAGAWDPARASALTWLCATARDCAIHRRRAGDGRGADPIAVAFGAGDPCAASVAWQDDTAQRVLTSFDRLDARESGPIAAAFFRGATYPELARESGVPVGTMKGWVRHGLARMRQHLTAD